MRIKPKYEVTTIHNIALTIDVSMLAKNETLFFNATEIAKQFGKLPADFLRLDTTKEYIAELMEESGNGISHIENFVKVTKGGANQGTWLHNDLAIEFAGWCSPAFKRKLHKWAVERLQREHAYQLTRTTLKVSNLSLTDAIKLTNPNPKPHHFSNEADMINKLVTGLSAKKYKELKGVEDVRAGLTPEESQVMDEVINADVLFLKVGLPYAERKLLLEKLAPKPLIALQ